jgi:hypothetical protein
MKRIIVRFSLIFCFFFAVTELITTVSYAQQVVLLDWSKRPIGQGASMNLEIAGAGAQQTVSFQVANVNNILYQYTMSCQLRSDTSTSPDFSQLIGILVKGKLEGASNDQNAQKVLTTISDYLSQSSCASSDSCSSIALKDAIDKAKEVLGAPGIPSDTTLNGLLAKDNQTSGGDLSVDVKQKVVAAAAQLQVLVSATHSVSFTESIDSTKAYTCTVSEYLNQSHNGQLLATKDGTMAIAVGKPASIVTLSIGPLVSAIQNRTYSSVTAPNGSSGTSTVLAVQGKSPSVAIAALANFALPLPARWNLNSDKFGLAVSAGPAVRISSGSSSSPAGFFGGLSVHLWRQFFITPGFHVGQFADYPLGFSAPGQTIPANFPTPQPVTRTTVKFAISFSYQAKDFSSLKQAGTATTTSPSTPSKPAPSTGATGGSANSASTNSTPNAGTKDPASLAISPNPIDFGADKASVQVTITNTGGTKAQLGWDVDPKPTPFNYQDATTKCQTVAPSGSCSFQATLARPSGSAKTTLHVSVAGGQPLNVDVKWQ